MRRYLASLVHDGGTLAFAATVVAAFASLFFSNDEALPAGTVLALLALGALFLFIGTYGYDHLPHHSLAINWLYLITQAALASLILFLSHAHGFTALLYFPLVSHAWYSLPRRQALLAAALITAAFMLVIGLLAGWLVALQNSFIVLAGLIFVAVFTEQAMREQRARAEVERLARELADANQRLRAHAEQVEELATAKERNRLAREIHDSLGHYLTVINVQLEAARLLLDRGEPLPAETGRALAALSKAQSLAQEGLGDVRRSVAALRAGPNGSRPLPEAIGALAEEARAAGIVTHVHLQGQPRPLSAQAELTLYRAAQEALTNVRKHARASRADVTLDYEARERVCLTVADNGVGSADASGGFGLLGLRERVQLLGGNVSTRTSVGEGFELRVEVGG
jgi:signal transduction histidine kinase